MAQYWRLKIIYAGKTIAETGPMTMTRADKERATWERRNRNDPKLDFIYIPADAPVKTPQQIAFAELANDILGDE